MIPHLNGRAAALKPLGWTGRGAEWLALVCLHSGVFLRAQYLAFLGRSHGDPATQFMERYRTWCGRRIGRRAAVEPAWRGTARLCLGGAAVAVPGAGSRARAATARGVSRGGAPPPTVARLRDRSLGGAVAGDRGGESLGADRGRRPELALPRKVYRGRRDSQRRYFAHKLPVALGAERAPCSSRPRT